MLYIVLYCSISFLYGLTWCYIVYTLLHRLMLSYMLLFFKRFTIVSHRFTCYLLFRIVLHVICTFLFLTRIRCSHTFYIVLRRNNSLVVPRHSTKIHLSRVPIHHTRKPFTFSQYIHNMGYSCLLCDILWTSTAFKDKEQKVCH